MIRLFLTAVILAAQESYAAGQMKSLIPFELEDQFAKSYTDRDVRNYYVILLGGDRKGSTFCFAWSDAMKEELKSDALRKKIEFLGVADLKAAPGALHRLCELAVGIIRASVKCAKFPYPFNNFASFAFLTWVNSFRDQ